MVESAILPFQQRRRKSWLRSQDKTVQIQMWSRKLGKNIGGMEDWPTQWPLLFSSEWRNWYRGKETTPLCLPIPVAAEAIGTVRERYMPHGCHLPYYKICGTIVFHLSEDKLQLSGSWSLHLWDRDQSKPIRSSNGNQTVEPKMGTKLLDGGLQWRRDWCIRRCFSWWTTTFNVYFLT